MGTLIHRQRVYYEYSHHRQLTRKTEYFNRNPILIISPLFWGVELHIRTLRSTKIVVVERRVGIRNKSVGIQYKNIRNILTSKTIYSIMDRMTVNIHYCDPRELMFFS